MGRQFSLAGKTIATGAAQVSLYATMPDCMLPQVAQLVEAFATN